MQLRCYILPDEYLLASCNFNWPLLSRHGCWGHCSGYFSALPNLITLAVYSSQFEYQIESQFEYQIESQFEYQFDSQIEFQFDSSVHGRRPRVQLQACLCPQLPLQAWYQASIWIPGLASLAGATPPNARPRPAQGPASARPRVDEPGRAAGRPAGAAQRRKLPQQPGRAAPSE